ELRFPGGPQGFEEPAPGHYHVGKKSGDFTHYGDGALLQLRSLVERGAFDAADFGTRFVAMIASPTYTGYRDHAAKGTLANFQAFQRNHPGEGYGYQDGADDDQLATASRLAPVAARHFRDVGYLEVLERATRVCQNNGRAVAYNKAHALILREIFMGNGLEIAIRHAALIVAGDGANGVEVAGGITAALKALELPVKEATLKFGQTCPLPGSFPAAIHCALHNSSD